MLSGEESSRAVKCSATLASAARRPAMLIALVSLPWRVVTAGDAAAVACALAHGHEYSYVDTSTPLSSFVGMLHATVLSQRI